MILLRATAIGIHAPLEASWPRGNLERAAMIQRLDSLPGQHLVIVSQFPFTDKEWVYNEPDIDRSSIVWARDMGKDGNQELLTYFSGRNQWWLDPSTTPPTLTPYAGTGR